jgi:hypothetical protein
MVLISPRSIGEKSPPAKSLISGRASLSNLGEKMEFFTIVEALSPDLQLVDG